MKISEAFEKSPESGDLLPEKLQSASTMAGAILGADDEALYAFILLGKLPL